ncbi:MAG: PQQ-dependent sugar dehydrogenase [Acidobacteria bacterium]|nr:PQQ-dependent sugar dehydrogenase [Acidobacteriota bacterium]
MTGLRQPTFATSARDGSGRLFIVEQAGLVKILWHGELFEKPFLDIRSRVNFGGELGLLSIAFPPGFSDKQHFYAYYIDKDRAVIIARYRVSEDPNIANADSEEIVLRLPQPFGQHNGGLIAFHPLDGTLYLATGDGGFSKTGDLADIPDPLENAQRTDSLLGKMLRIDVGKGEGPYTIPADNPKKEGWLPEIWARGFRNPWRFSFDRLTGDLYIGDVGDNEKEEIDFEAAGTGGGRNYGWRLREGTSCLPEMPCDEVQGLTWPLHEYDHTEGCSVIGGVVYRGAKYPELQGTYIYGDFCNAMVWGMRQGEDGWKRAQFGYSSGLPVTFSEDEDGEVYLVDWEGNLLQLIVEPPPAEPVQETIRPPDGQKFRRDRPTRGKRPVRR